MENDRLTLMLVHAHPDDESIGTGGVMAKYAAENIHTVLVTCTRGELGDIQDPEFVPPKPGMDITDIRKIELENALAILNPGAFYYLGYRDSGMAGTPGNKDPRAFAMADLSEASRRLVTIIRRERPHVVVTYDETGIYWHPDHVMAHKVTQKAFFDAGNPDIQTDNGAGPWTPAKLYHIAIPLSRLEKANRASGDNEPPKRPSAIVGTPDEKITTCINVQAYLDLKFQAIFSHKSQISPRHPFRNLTPELKMEMFGHEHFVCAHGCKKSALHEKEPDLFTGLRT